MNNTEKTKIDIFDIQKIIKSHEYIFNALNLANLKGVFSLNEASTLKIHSDILLKSIENLDKYQQFVIELSKKNDTLQQ